MEITNEARSKIQEILPSGSTILELGSGHGTKKLLDMGYKVISIEQDPNWQFLYHNNYICCPIKEYPKKGSIMLELCKKPLSEEQHDNEWWYDDDVLSSLSELKYDFIIIDGPSGPNAGAYDYCRMGFVDHQYLFNMEVPILVDDTDRKYEKELAQALCVDREFEDYGGFYIIY